MNDQIRLYLATSNKNKVREVNEILAQIDFIKNIQLQYIFDEMEDKEVKIIENGESFIENSVIKAWSYGKIIKKPVLSDDSGLSILCLKDFPGINSSRFLEDEPYEKKMEKILAMLEGEEDRRAFFACAATYFDIEKNILLSFEERIYGTISYGIKGTNGFGYDPIFIPEGFKTTFGELKKDIKNKISHRAKAFGKLFSFVEKNGLLY